MLLCQENFPTYQAHEPATENLILDGSDWICLKNAAGCLITFMHWYSAHTSFTLSVHEDTATGGGTTAIAVDMPIWVNLNTASTDAAVNTMVRQPDDTDYEIVTDTTFDQIVQIYVDASILSAGLSWIQLGCTAGNVGNYGSAIYQLDGYRYKQKTPPSDLGL